jgi:hypothetical protein
MTQQTKGHDMRTRLRWATAAVLAAASIPAAVAVAALNDEVVRGTPADEFLPHADGDAGFLAWSQNSAAHPKHYDAFVSQSGGPEVRVNEDGTLGFAGGIDGNVMVYQQVRGNSSGLRLFDLTTQTRSTPAGVNTGQWEWQPTISGEWLLFGRQTRTRSAIILHNLTTGEDRVLVDMKGFARPGQVNGDYVSYDRCGAKLCNVFRYRISTGRTIAAPNRQRRVQYAPSVSADGTLYFGSSPPACGRDVQIRKFAPGDIRATILTELPPGRDLETTYADDRADGSTDLLHDRGKCGAGNQNLFKLVDPA